MSGCSIHVSGLPKGSSKTDLEIYFQSRKKSNGGDIEEIEFHPDRGEARIVFEDSSVAERVLAKAKHEHKGARLTLTREMQSTVDRTSKRPYKEELEDLECASVLVSGLSSKTTKDAIQMYFENRRRSHGGDVIKVELNGNQAVVTFESPNDAKTVLEWGKHTLDECPLTVTKPVQSKKTPPLKAEEESEQPVKRSRVVRVEGISDKTTKDALLNFFENTRRSGGGEIEDIQHIPEKRLADITFCSPDDAARVSEKEGLELDGSKIAVLLKEIPKEIPKDPIKLHVMGIGEKTTRDGLESFMEVVSGEEVESTLFGSNSNAMVSFKEPPDIDKVQKKCSTRALDGSHLKIEQVNICDCIEVTGLAPNTTKDTVYYYFDNPRNGGGEVTDVKIDPDNTRAMVFFKDTIVVDNVVKGNHTINDAKLKVVPFYPFLGESSAEPGGKKEKVVKVDPQTMDFVNKFLKQEFDQLLQENRVKYTQQQDLGEIVLACTEPKMDKKTWENSCEAVAAYINQIVTEKITVSQEAWKEICEKAKEKCASFRDQVTINCKEKERSFTLTGKKSDVSVLAERLNDLNSEIQKQIEYKKNNISKSIPLSEAQLELLSFSGFVEDLQARCKDLEVKLSKNDRTIEFTGPDAVVREGNITVWQTLSRVKEMDMEQTKSIVSVLGSPAGKIFMSTKFKTEHIDAVVNCDPHSDNQLVVTALDRTDAKKAVDLIKYLTSEQSIPLDEHQKQLIHSEKWKELKHSIQQSMLLQVREEPAASTLWIAGIKEEVDKVKEKVDEFFEENIILDEVIDTDKGCLKFILKYRKDAIQSMEKSLTSQSVKITKKSDAGDDEGSALVVSGTRDGIHKAVPKVQKLIDEIIDRKVDLDKPGMKKLFREKKGITQLSVVENDHDCIIERCTISMSDAKRSLSKISHGNNSFSKLICSFVTPEGKKILLYKGDLTEHKVDVMVNAGNRKLDHIGGLAKSIVVKGGQEIQDECNDYVMRNGDLLDGDVFVSRPGKLPCKCLVHAVGPRFGFTTGDYKSRTQGEEKKALILGQTVINSLEKADKFSSIAIPAISAGVFGCPVKVCAKTLLESALEYSEENSHSRLSEIHFVDMNEDAIRAFHDEMKARFGKDHSFTDGATPKADAKSGDVAKGKRKGRGNRRSMPKGKEQENEPITEEPATSFVSESAGVYDDPNSLTTAQGMKILVIVGDLAKEEAHAIVNTVASDIDLNRNPCAKALSDAAGPQLQQECKSKGPLSAGQVLVTDGYNLGCKNVFHVVAGDWNGGQTLRSLLQSCLNEAHNRGFSSIAFPAIGTGKLSYPRDVVARAFFEEADAFKSKTPQSPLNEIHLVLFYKDQPTVQAFQDELRSRKPKVAKGKRRSYVSKNEDNEDFAKGFTSKEPIESLVAISQEEISGSSYIGSVRLEIVSGDITKETTDAIVTVSNTSLNVSFGGGVGAAIAKAGGPTIQQECNKLGPQKPESVVSTSAGTLPTKKIFHLALVSTSFVSKGILDVMVTCLRKADAMGITSIAVPAIGTGMGGVSPKDAAKGLLSAIGKFSQQNPTSVNHIRIVIFQEKILQVFDSAIDELSESKTSMLATLWKGVKAGVKGMFGFGETVTGAYEPMTEFTENTAAASFHPEDKMWLQVYAASERNLKKAETDIHKLITENSKIKEIENKAIAKLSDEQRGKVMKLEVTHDTKIQIDKRISRIVIRGVAEDVSNATVAVYDILNETSEEEHTRRYAELLSKNVQWYYEDGDDWEPYDDETNAKIEQAHKDKNSAVRISLEEEGEDKPTHYKIDLKTMIEKNLDNGDTTRVDRREKTAGIPLPTHWDPQPKGGDGKELDLHMVVLDPVKHKKEYDEIKTAIAKTLAINVIKIERVQNPGLYRTYAVKKQKMDDQSRSNEMKLFHGTAAATCQLINHQGFNRSFCGKNATAFGKGVYFARDASYSGSSTYSPPDHAGNRYMYMASVLVGQYTKGQSNMITPPPKNPINPSITYDTVVNDVSNPAIFVVFHDTQNYPDYLITFK